MFYSALGKKTQFVFSAKHFYLKDKVWMCPECDLKKKKSHIVRIDSSAKFSQTLKIWKRGFLTFFIKFPPTLRLHTGTSGPYPLSSLFFFQDFKVYFFTKAD